MPSETLMKCAHPACLCLVEAEQRFCSSACSSDRGYVSGPCLCGHPGCTGERPLEDDELDIHTKE
jgi:metallothionein